MRASRRPWRPFRRTALLLCLLLTTISAAGAAQVPQQVRPGQQLPTPDQAREMLQNQPDLVRQLRERLQESGLTDDQIRARLRAAGYPENILDQYLSGADTSIDGAPRSAHDRRRHGARHPLTAGAGFPPARRLHLRDVGLLAAGARLVAVPPSRLAAGGLAGGLARGDSARRARTLRHPDLPSPVHPVRADGCRAGGRELSAGSGRRTGPDPHG